jgi:hypothetical protein
MYQEVLKSTRTQLVLEHVLTVRDLPSYTSAARLQMLRPASGRRQLILDRARHVAPRAQQPWLLHERARID